MKRFPTIVMAVLFSLTLVLGCGGEDSRKSEGTQPGGVDQAAGADSSKVVVTVNGIEVTEGQVTHETDLMMKQYAGRVSPDQIAAMASSMRSTAMDNIINRTLLRQAADREGIPAPEEAVEERIAEVRSNFPDEETFLRQLETSGLTMDSFRREVEYTIKLETLMDRMTADLEKADEEAAREFYEGNSERFVQPEQIRASHVLVKVEQGESEELKAEKRRKIEGLHARIEAGEDFAAVASENSDCPSAANGGDLGFFGKGQMVRPFEEAAFSLDTGEVSDVVETRFGYHVIKVTERKEGSTTPFGEVSGDIMEYLDGMTRQQELEKYVAALRDLATIEYADSAGQ